MVCAGRGGLLGRRWRCYRGWIGLTCAAVLVSNAGCGIVPPSRMDQCERLGRLLRDENARLKDQVLSLRSQNRDLADRAVDDQRRLSARDETIEHLERSVQAYQSERERLAAAFEELKDDLGGASRAGAGSSLSSGPSSSSKTGERSSPPEAPPARGGAPAGEDLEAPPE